MMPTIINMTKVFVRGENVEVVYFFASIRSTYREHSRKATRGVSSGNLEVCTFNFCNIFYKGIKLGKL